MRIETCIDNYIREGKREELIRICVKLGVFADSTSVDSYLKNKIIEKLMNINNIENIIENCIPPKEDGSSFIEDISNLVMGLPIDNTTKLFNTLEEWGLVYSGKVPDEIALYLFNKYRNKQRVLVSEQRQLNSYSIILNTICIISIIYNQSHLRKATLSYDELKFQALKFNIDESTLVKILSLLIHKHKILNSKQYNFLVAESISKWINDYGQERFITDLYRHFIGDQNDMNNILSDLRLFEDDGKYFVRSYYLIKKHGKIAVEKLYNLGVLEKVDYNGMILYKRSYVGLVLDEKRLPDYWKRSNEIVETEDKVYIPHNINPFLILEYLLKYKLTDESDFMLIFMKK